MTDRIRRMAEEFFARSKHFTIVAEKEKLYMDAMIANDGWPVILKSAKAVEAVLDHRTIFIGKDDLLAGYTSCKPFSSEFRPNSAAWPDDDLDKIISDGGLSISDEDRKILRSYDDYWLGKGRDAYEQQIHYHDDRLWEFRKRGVLSPPWTDRQHGQGGFTIGVGWGAMVFNSLQCPDYKMHLYTGFDVFLEKARKMRKELRIFTRDDLEKADYLDSTIIAFEAFERIAVRYADLAASMAETEEDPVRAKELRQIADQCRTCLSKGAKTFREGIQALTFYWCLFSDGTLPLERVDQLLYPLYKADLEAGRITPEEALELIQCYRLKVADFYYISGTPTQREKWAGMCRFNVMVLGGCDEDGNDAVNDLSYMFLEAAKELPLTHPSMHVRVNEKTPHEFLVKAMEVVKTGVGYPAFLSDKAYIDYLVTHGVDIREAREFCVNGCIDIALPGRSRNGGVPMFTTPIILDLTLNNGEDLFYHTKCGLATGKFEDFKTWDEFYQAFLAQARHQIAMFLEINAIRITQEGRMYQDALLSGFYEGSLEAGKDIYQRRMKFENSNALNVMGIATTIDSLIAIKKVVYDDKSVSAKRLLEALHANWEGYEDVRELCVKAPKYGNNDPYADEVAVAVWDDFKAIAQDFKSPFGTPILLSAVSITAHGPGGKITPATPNGRFACEVLSDGAVSPCQGADTHGPIAVLQSAMKVAKGWSCALHNMKFHPSAMATEEDLGKVAEMVRTYMENGGHHIQFNVVDKKTLDAADEHPENYQDLIVRVAGYSAYYVDLTHEMKVDVKRRTEHDL